MDSCGCIQADLLLPVHGYSSVVALALRLFTAQHCMLLLLLLLLLQ